MDYLFKKIKLYQKPLFFFSSFLTANFLFLYRKNIYNYFHHLLTFKKTVKKNILSLGEEYVENKKNKFITFIEKNIDNANANLDAEFYNKESYNNAISEVNNQLEKKWKTRILKEYTPRGNVFMYYDAYKMGFSYHSDTNIPNPLLNAVAMEYCILFKCSDLFIDQNIVDKKNESPLIKIHHIEKKKESKTKKNKESGDLPFAKLRNYNKDKINVKTQDKKQYEENKNKPLVNKVTNKFIHLGKVYKMNWLQKQPTKDSKIKCESKYLDDLKKEDDLQKTIMSYKDYKMYNTS